MSEAALRPCDVIQPMRVFKSTSPPPWLETESAVAVPLSTTHSVAVQLFTGRCAYLGGISSDRCRPECALPNKDVCDGTPLGAGIAMCSRTEQIGPLATIDGTLSFPTTPKIVEATGHAHCSLLPLPQRSLVHRHNHQLQGQGDFARQILHRVRFRNNLP